MMKAQAETDPPEGSQRDVVTRQIHALESIDFFEMAETIPPLLAIRKVLVHKIADPSLRTRSHGLRNERVCRSLVFMLHHRKDVHNARLGSGFVRYEFGEADHFGAQKCPKIKTTVKKGTRIFPRPLEGHPVMRKTLALTNWAFVVNLADSLKKFFSKRHLSQYHPPFFCLPCPVAGERTNLVVPPMLKRRYWDDREIIPFHRIGIFRL